MANSRRPKKLKPSIIRLAGELAAEGMPIKDIAGRCGVTVRAMRMWLQVARETGDKDQLSDHEALCAAFASAIAEGESSCVKICVGSVLSAARSNWKAAIEYLQLRFPDRWKDETEEDRGTGNITIVFGGDDE